MSIPADHITFDGDTAWMVLPPFDPETEMAEDDPRSLDRPCHTCGGEMLVVDPHEPTSSVDCPDCIDGRHTFEIEVERPVDGWHPDWTGDPECKCRPCTGEACWVGHPFDEHCNHDSIDRHADRECDDPEFRTHRVSIVPGMVLEIWRGHPPTEVRRFIAAWGDDWVLVDRDTNTGPIIAAFPPAAKPGMWVVQLKGEVI